MARRNGTDTDSTASVAESPSRTAPVTLAPMDGAHTLLSHWRGFAEVLGAQATWNVTDEGVYAEDVTFDGDLDPAQIIADMDNGEERRVSLFPAIFYLNGRETEAYTNPLDLTKWMQSAFKKVETEDGHDRSPSYVKDKIAAYKLSHEFPKRRGRPRSIVKIDMANLDESVVNEINLEEIEKLEAFLKVAREKREAEATPVAAVAE